MKFKGYKEGLEKGVLRVNETLYANADDKINPEGTPYSQTRITIIGETDAFYIYTNHNPQFFDRNKYGEIVGVSHGAGSTPVINKLAKSLVKDVSPDLFVVPDFAPV